MEAVLISIILLVLVWGFFAQYIDGALGMGYGATSASLILGTTTLYPAIVSASVHTAEIFVSAASGLSHLRFGNVHKKIALPLTCTGVIGGVIGALFVSEMLGEFVKPFVGIILFILGLRIFLRYYLKNKLTVHSKPKGEFSKKFLLPVGLVGGAVDAIGGGGWGPVCTSTLVSANKKEPRYVVGSVNISEFFTTLAIVATFGLTLGFETFLWYITIPLIIGGVIAAPVAAYTCKKISATVLGLSTGIILMVLNSRTIAKSLPRLIGVGITNLELIFIPVGIILASFIALRLRGKRQRRRL